MNVIFKLFGRTFSLLLALAALSSCSSLLDSGDGSSSSSSAASIELRYGTSTIASGGTVNAGSVLIGNYKDLVFAIRNKGSKYLVLSGTPVVAFEGTDASQFVLRTTSFPTILKVGEYVAFKVRFTPTSLGTKTVTMKISSTDGTSSEFKMTVSSLSYKIPVTSIGFSPTALPLMVGETGLLTATIAPANATYSSVTWASADPAIATVSDAGLVTGIAVGSTTITATTDAGDYSAAFAVSVYTPYTPTSWTTTTTTTAYGGRRYHQSVVLNGTLYIIGGNNTSDTRLNDVWSSTDGANFTNILTTGASPFAGRRWHACAVFNGRIWLVGGQSDGGDLNDVWSSADGISWTQATSAAAFSPRLGHRLVTDGEKLYLIGSSSDSLYNDVWSTIDGVTWTEVLPASGVKDSTNRFLNRSSPGCAYLNGSFYIYGGRDTSGFPTAVYRSSDKGKTWTSISSGYSSVGRDSSGYAVYGGKMWLAGGAYDYGIYTTLNDLVSSADGITWTEVLPDGNTFFSRRNGLTMAVLNNKLFVIGGTTDGTAGNSQQDVWQVQ